MIGIELVKCLDAALHGIVGHAESQINRLDYRIDPDGEDAGRWRLGAHGFFRLVYVNLLVLVFTGTYIAIERGSITLAEPYPWLAKLLHELALFGFILSLYLLLRHRLHRDKEKLRSELEEWIGQRNEGHASIANFVNSFDMIVSQALENGLTQAESHDLVQQLFGLATPPNSELSAKLDRLAEELPLTLDLAQLTPKTLNVLRNLMKRSIIDQDWGELFFTFAIYLQLSPWVDAASHKAYQFTRHYDDVHYLFGESQAKIRYRQFIREDLQTILSLVNGKLWSVMFRDIDVWTESAYYVSNSELLRRVRANKETSLRRLFLYENDWPDDRMRFRALAGAAMWHQDNDYECRFADRDSVDSSIVSSVEKYYVASCLVNGTRIIMSQKPLPRPKATSKDRENRVDQEVDEWFRYQCDVDAAMVAAYAHDFNTAWLDMDAREPSDFLNILGDKNDAWLKETQDWYNDFKSRSQAGQRDA